MIRSLIIILSLKPSTLRKKERGRKKGRKVRWKGRKEKGGSATSNARYAAYDLAVYIKKREGQRMQHIAVSEKGG